MKTKREESILDIIRSFEEMADTILAQLKLLEKYMSSSEDESKEKIRLELEENEYRIDKFEVLLSEKFINSIVLYQPVASDIRKLVAMYRMSINLERVGDMVINILHSMENIKNSEEYKAMAGVINTMLLSSTSMVECSLLSFINNDDKYAVWTIKNDEIVDEMNRKLLVNSISRSNLSDRHREMLLSYVDLKSVISNIERIADHATNIAEASIYSMQGTDIRHTDLETDLSTNTDII